MEKNEIVYDSEKMRTFMKQDAYLRFVVKDLMSRGHSEEDAMKYTFNGSILDDFIMENIYRTL